MHALRTGGLVALLGALFATACGDAASSMSPTAPSGAVLSGASGSVVSQDKGGNGNGNGNPHKPDPPAAPTTPTPGAPSNPVTGKVEIEGLIASIAGLSLTVNGLTILVPPTAVIRHGSQAVLFADLRVGDRVHVKANKLQDGTLEATEVKLQNPGDGDDGDASGGTASVSVGVLDALASESAGDTGVFRLTRVPTASLPVTSPLTVTFTLTGTAVNGTDYQNLPLTAAFAAGQATVDVIVTPLADGLFEGTETVILTLTGVAPYVLGTPTTGTVTITDMPAVTVTAFDPSASETGPNTGTFRFTRGGSTAAALTIGFTLGGTAIKGTDYVNIPSFATFPIGQATVDLVITPIADGLVEGTETVVLSLVDGALYDLGTPNFATITITD